MPDASGNFKGITVPPLPASMEADRSELNVSDGGAKARENSQGAKPNPEIRAWEEACKQAAINSALRQAEQDR